MKNGQVLRVENIPSTLMAQAKALAALRRITLKEWVREAIEEKIKKEKISDCM